MIFSRRGVSSQESPHSRGHRWRRSSARRPRPLSVRLSRFVALVVCAVLTLMVVASGVAMRSWMTSRIDQNLTETLNRAVSHSDFAPPPPPSDETLPPVSETPTPPPSFSDDEDWDGHGHGRAPRGLRGPGSGDGQLQLVQTSEGVQAGLVRGFDIQTLSTEAQEILLKIPTDSMGCTVTLSGVGSFRVMATQKDDRLIVVGQSMSQNNSTVMTLVAVESVAALVIIIAAAYAGRRWAIRELSSLGSVAGTARTIASRDLATASHIEPIERVSDDLAHRGTEVGDVGNALNTMIDNVEYALQARAESEQRLRQFVADASHELRTPLASIQGYTQLLRQGNAETELALSRIASESARMAGLVEDLLLLARLDAGRELADEPVDLLPLVLDALSDAHAASQDHEWTLDVPEGDIDQYMIRGDESAVRQVLANLVNNARVHTPAGTRVTLGIADVPLSEDDLETTPDGMHTWKAGAGPAGASRLSVSDNGTGIAPELRDTVFDRFVRGDSSRTRSGKGSSGLGLSIVASIAQALKGRVAMTTVCEGEGEPGEHGTTFEVVFPRMVLEADADTDADTGEN